jgi:hypothetical protein
MKRTDLFIENAMLRQQLIILKRHRYADQSSYTPLYYTWALRNHS